MANEFLGESLIFLISQPRAGSTLLQRILAGHPSVATSAEPWLMLHPVYALRETGLQSEYEAGWAHTALTDFLTHYADGEETYLQAIRAFARVLYERALLETGKEFFLDKTPRYYLIIPDLCRLFPKARFVFLLRNPLAVLASILSTWVQGDWRKLANFRHDLLVAPRRILDGIEMLGDKAVVARYEEVVTTPLQAVRAICEQLGLSFSDDMLRYADMPIPKGRFGDPTGVYRHEAPTTVNLKKWLHLGDCAQTKRFALAYMAELGSEVIERMGYPAQEFPNALKAAETISSPVLVPWQIVIRPPETWTVTERLNVELALAFQREGLVRGTVSLARRNVRTVVRLLLPVLWGNGAGRGPSSEL